MTRCWLVKSRGMTLLEAVLSIVIVSIVAAILTPIVIASSDSYATASDARERTERAAHALDRVVRLIREVPLDDEAPTRLGIASINNGSLVLEDGRSVRLLNGTLAIENAQGRSGTLCDDASVFRVEMFGPDGVTPVTARSELAHVAQVRLVAGGLDLRTRVLPRVRLLGAP